MESHKHLSSYLVVTDQEQEREDKNEDGSGVFTVNIKKFAGIVAFLKHVIWRRPKESYHFSKMVAI